MKKKTKELIAAAFSAFKAVYAKEVDGGFDIFVIVERAGDGEYRKLNKAEEKLVLALPDSMFQTHLFEPHGKNTYLSESYITIKEPDAEL